MNTNTGTAQTYNDGDQRQAPRSSDAPERYEAGQANAHNLHDSKDNRSLLNRADLETRQEAREEQWEQEAHKTDPTAPAKAHGNRPSRGAEIDKQLQEEDELRLQEKGQA
ncbi:hypothetical protein BDW22DRAFT_1424594 [Trametopsis cervina]|nr:hypothetical protein BDW22DRAFT_1424594 [Trametopsis cervina]